MSASKKRPISKIGRHHASASKRGQVGASGKPTHRAQSAEGAFEKGAFGAGEVFPTQVMGWSRTAAETEMPMVAMLTGADGASTHVAQAMVQSNAEVVALVGRRSRACLDFPAHLSKCQTPQQVLEQQSQFFRDMLMDYHAANDRIIKAWFEFEPRS